MFRRRQPEEERQPINGLFRVDLRGKTLDEMVTKGFRIYYSGDRARATKDDRGLSGKVAFYRVEKSFGEPWNIQLEMIAQAAAELKKPYPELDFGPSPNGATLIEGAIEVNKNYGVNLLPLWSRYGDGSLIGGFFGPRSGASVSDDWHPYVRSRYVGAVAVAVNR